MDKNITLSSSETDYRDIFEPSSRKRKLIATGVETKSGNHFPHDLNQQQGGSFSGTSGQRHTHQSWLYSTNSLESITSKNRFPLDQLHWQNSSEPWPTSNGYLSLNIGNNSAFSMQSMPFQSLQHEGCSPLSKMPARKMPELLNFPPETNNMFVQTGSSGIPSLPKSYNAPLENPHIEVDKFVNSGIKKHGTPEVSSEIRKISPESLRSVETSLWNLSQPTSYPGGFDKRTCLEEATKMESSCEWINHQVSKNAGIGNLPSEVVDSSRASTVESGNQKSLQNLLKSGSSSSSWGEEKSGHKEQGLREANICLAKQAVTDKETVLKQSLVESVKDGVMSMTTIKQAHSSKLNTGSSKLLEKDKSFSAKAAPLLNEKLWEGSLQLNSSVTVSAVAFYKSGERLLDVNWSECVEVKGKVRLDAFEKYIQDLPRSRTRGLMVTSLCWKKGSAETGLKGMKEIAKGYRKGERVGFANLSQGVDIYLCPNSDKIITILAKYGFFKGLAAGEDKSELMLGCVVWRKNLLASLASEKKSKNSGAVEKKSEDNNSLSHQILKTPSDSSTHSVIEICSSSAANSAINCSSALGTNVTERKKIEVDQMSPFTDFLPTASVQTMMSVPEICVRAEVEQSKTSSELQKAVMPFPCGEIKATMPVADDDDLPEFDFGAACENPLASVGRHLDTAVLARMLPPKQTQTSDRVLPQSMSNANSVSPTPKSSLDGRDKKNLFSDDEDMPEWLPPQHQKQSLVKASKPSAVFVNASLNSTSQDQPQRPSGPLPPTRHLSLPQPQPQPPFPVPAHPDYPSRGFPTFHCQPPSSRVPPPIPFQNGPRSLAGFTFIQGLPPVLGSSAAKLPQLPTNHRGQRP